MQTKSKHVTAILICFGLIYLIYFSLSEIDQPSKNDLQFIPKISDIDQVIHNFLQSKQTLITPIIHQSWKTHLLPTNRSKRWSASWRGCFPHWEWKLWSDEENFGLIRDHYPWFLPTYLGFNHSIERADVSRYFYMYHYGGIYTDLDTVCVKNFNHLLKNFSLVFSGMDGGIINDEVLKTYVQNSFMVSRPRHPFWMRLISRIMVQQHIHTKGRPEVTTGPQPLMSEIRDYLRHTKRDLIIYNSQYFNPFSWYRNKVKECKDLGQMTEAEEKACLAAHSKSYVVQLHTQSWLKGTMK